MMELEIAHDYLQCMKLFSDLSFLTIANHPLLFNIHSTRVSGGICFLSVHKLTRLNTVSRPSIHLTFCTPPFLYNHPNFTHSAQSPLLSFKHTPTPSYFLLEAFMAISTCIFFKVSDLQNTIYALVFLSFVLLLSLL